MLFQFQPLKFFFLFLCFFIGIFYFKGGKKINQGKEFRLNPDPRFIGAGLVVISPNGETINDNGR